jgi:hypothetical protein
VAIFPTLSLKVKFPTLLGFSLMVAKKSLVIVQTFCFLLNLALIHYILVYYY